MNDIAVAVEVYCRLQKAGVTYVRRGTLFAPEPPRFIITHLPDPVRAYEEPTGWKAPGNYPRQHSRRPR